MLGIKQLETLLPRERDKFLKSVSKENDPALKNILYARYKTIRNIITQRKGKAS